MASWKLGVARNMRLQKAMRNLRMHTTNSQNLTEGGGET